LIQNIYSNLKAVNAIAGEEGQKVNFVELSAFSFDSTNLTEETFNFSGDWTASTEFQVVYS
jgi:hypothetical protein